VISGHFSVRRIGRTTAAAAAAGILVLALAAAHSASASHRAPRAGFTFTMVRTPGVPCLPNARGSVTIVRGALNETMTVTVKGLPHKTGFDLFVIEVPNKPFGVAWYQTDVHTDDHGTGTATVKGVFNKETFSVSVGGTTTFAPTHQYHLGLWFNNPNVPFNLGCEAPATVPIITPFNGAQHAGIQILNTSNFPDNAGPLSHVK
jgi:hypothetical protein